jgi:hypothetical protein
LHASAGFLPGGVFGRRVRTRTRRRHSGKQLALGGSGSRHTLSCIKVLESVDDLTPMYTDPHIRSPALHHRCTVALLFTVLDISCLLFHLLNFLFLPPHSRVLELVRPGGGGLAASASRVRAEHERCSAQASPDLVAAQALAQRWVAFGSRARCQLVVVVLAGRTTEAAALASGLAPLPRRGPSPAGHVTERRPRPAIHWLL